MGTFGKDLLENKTNIPKITQPKPDTSNINLKLSFKSNKLEDIVDISGKTVRGYSIIIEGQPNVDLKTFKTKSDWIVIDNKSKKFLPISFYWDGLIPQKNSILSALKEELEKRLQQSSALPILKGIGFDLSLKSPKTQVIKPGVEELFDSKPELANAIYEALGFENSLEEVNHYTKINPIDFDFSNFQRGKLNISQYGDGLNVAAGKNEFLEKRYGTPIKGFVDTKSFPVIDTNRTAIEIYDYLKSLGYNFKENRKEYEFYSDESLNENPANSYELFEDFRKSNPDVKGVTILNHKIGAEKTVIDKFYVIYNAKSFYGNNQITPEQKQQAQQLYSSYLQTTNNPTIEGFKQWNNRQQQINELFESTPEFLQKIEISAE
jgi:hypothetical protein